MLLLLLQLIVFLLHSSHVDAKCSTVRYLCVGARHAVAVAPGHSSVAPSSHVKAKCSIVRYRCAGARHAAAVAAPAHRAVAPFKHTSCDI